MNTETQYSLDAEKAVLGAVLISPKLWPSVSSELTDGDFYRGAHRLIFNTLADLSRRSAVVDTLTVVDALRLSGGLDEVGGPAYVSGLTDGIPSSANVGAYVRIVKEKARLRALAAIGHSLAVSANERADLGSTLLAEEAMRSLIGLDTGERRDVVRSKRAVDDYIETMILGEQKAPVTTGFIDLDRLIGGFMAGELVILAARPSVGKTALALEAARMIARAESTVMMFSLEMSMRAITSRLISIESGVPASAIERGDATVDQLGLVSDAHQRMVDVPLYFQCSARTPTEVEGWCRRIRQESGRLDCVLVDYLQLLAPDHRGREASDDVASISRALKLMAVRLNAVVIALSQLNRASEARRDKRPHISDLRGSGALEQDADMALLLFREEMYTKTVDNTGVAEVIVAKNRNGKTGTVKLAFDHRVGTFRNLAVEG